jgi:Arc/MetJ-type ribon-helix-helix transcriptional regulator
MLHDMARGTTERRHRTTVNLPVSLLRAAEEEVGSSSATETITAALREMVARRRRARLLQVELPDLTPAEVDKLRKPRLPLADA